MYDNQYTCLRSTYQSYPTTVRNASHVAQEDQSPEYMEFKNIRMNSFDVPPYCRDLQL